MVFEENIRNIFSHEELLTHFVIEVSHYYIYAVFALVVSLFLVRSYNDIYKHCKLYFKIISGEAHIIEKENFLRKSFDITLKSMLFSFLLIFVFVFQGRNYIITEKHLNDILDLIKKQQEFTNIVDAVQMALEMLVGVVISKVSCGENRRADRLSKEEIDSLINFAFVTSICSFLLWVFIFVFSLYNFISLIFLLKHCNALIYGYNEKQLDLRKRIQDLKVLYSIYKKNANKTIVQIIYEFIYGKNK